MAAGVTSTAEDGMDRVTARVLEAECFCRSPAELQAWMAGAQAGATFIYARGKGLDQQRDVVTLARRYADEGKVSLHNPRGPDGRLIWMVMRKAERPEEMVSDARTAALLAQPAARKLMEILSACAGMGEPCPTNGTLARRAGLKTKDRARYLMAQMEGAGLIRVQDRGRRLTRIVTIAATGQQTSAEATRVGKGFCG